MELTKKQEEGLRIALQRYNDHSKYVTISGYAGSGKSTLVRFIIEAMDIEEERVAYATFTGKAAEVLRKKGNLNAMTLHRLLYESIPRKDGGFFRKPKLHLDYDVVVVDECSMVPKTMIDMLLSHKAFIIFLGDPGQLPMIDKKESHDLLDHPHVFLDQIMRQAAESEIIQLTMKIRAGEEISYMQGKEVMVIPHTELVTGHLTWADMVLCATNATRHNINNQIRQLKGFTGIINEGESIVFKANYWDDCNEDGDALVNGTVGTFHNTFNSFIQIPKFIKNNRHQIPIIIGEFRPESGKPFTGIEIDPDFLIKEEFCVDWRVSYQLGKMKQRIGDILPKKATYGYCTTAWCAQGSEWNKVLVLEENFPFNKEEHQKFLYTCCTRASEKLVLIK